MAVPEAAAAAAAGGKFLTPKLSGHSPDPAQWDSVLPSTASASHTGAASLWDCSPLELLLHQPTSRAETALRSRPGVSGRSSLELRHARSEGSTAQGSKGHRFAALCTDWTGTMSVFEIPYDQIRKLSCHAYVLIHFFFFQKEDISCLLWQLG